MATNISIYILGDFRAGAADGLAEFNYQNVRLLMDTFTFHFIEFDQLEDKRNYKLEIQDDVTVHHFGARNRSAFKLSSIFKSWLRDLPGKDIVFHLSHIYNINNYLVAKELVRANIPYVVTPHDSYVYCSFFTKSKPCLKRFYRKIFVHIIDKYVLDHAAIVHDLTSQYSDCLKKLTDSPIIVVSNQVNDISLQSPKKNLKAQICFIGRFSMTNKGIDIALKSFAHFKSNSEISRNIKFLLIGPADRKAEVLCEKICNNLKLQVGRDVIFTGKIAETERNRILTESAVYMQLSRFEGFGLSVIQALSCSKPVIISSGIPIKDKIRKYNAGIVVSSPDEASLALERIFTLSPEAYSELSLNARRCYELEFHPTLVKPQLINLYEKAYAIKNC